MNTLRQIKKNRQTRWRFSWILQGSLQTLSFRQRFEIAIKIKPERGGEHGKAAQFEMIRCVFITRGSVFDKRPHHKMRNSRIRGMNSARIVRISVS
jgi:hypothetical protein